MKNFLVKLLKLEDTLDLFQKVREARDELDREYIETKGSWHCECACELCRVCGDWFYYKRTWKHGLIEKLYGLP